MTPPKSFFKFLHQHQRGHDDQLHPENTANPIGFVGIRFADTVEGHLSQRSPELLRRYIQSATDLKERERRQTALFLSASSALSIAPSVETVPGCSLYPGIPENQRAGVVQVGLFCMPVVITTSSPLKVSSRHPLDHDSTRTFTRELQDLLLKSCPQRLTSVRIESLISLPDLLGISPLLVQTAVSNEARRNAGDFKAEAPKIVPDLSNPAFDRWLLHQRNWSLKLPAVTEAVRAVGPKQPAAFLLVMYLCWDRRFPSPDIGQIGDGARVRLQDLLRHYLAHDKTTTIGEMGHADILERIRLRVGPIAPMHEAITHAQGLQLHCASEISQACELGFSSKVGRNGFDLHWTTTLHGQDADGEALDQTVVDYVYDASWRPDSHVHEVQRIANTTRRSSGQSRQTHESNVPCQVPFDFDEEALGDGHGHEEEGADAASNASIANQSNPTRH